MASCPSLDGRHWKLAKALLIDSKMGTERLAKNDDTHLKGVRHSSRPTSTEVSLFIIDASKVRLTPLAPAARRVGNGAAPQRSPPTVGRLAR